jgi:hypothetical protein
MPRQAVVDRLPAAENGIYEQIAFDRQGGQVAQHVVMTVSGTGTNMWDQTPPQPAAVANGLPGVATGGKLSRRLLPDGSVGRGRRPGTHPTR